MARFRGTIQGSRGQASRLGTTNGGIVTNTNGWQTGIKVIGSVDKNGKDVFSVYATSGSDGRNLEQFLGELTQDEYGQAYFDGRLAN